MEKGSRAPSETAGEGARPSSGGAVLRGAGGQTLRHASDSRQKPPDIPGSKPPSPPWLRIFGIGSAMGVILLAGALIWLDHWIRTAPMPKLSPEVSTIVLDRHGKLLRAYQVADGRWRLPVTVAEVDQGYLAQLLAYEDRRFYRHAGVDPLALLRAFWQAIIHGRPVSGASTITMQVARLLSEHPTDRIGTKLAQIRLALALERRLEKAEILDLYLTLAPFGGNIEGVRAASLSWFGKEPKRLTPAEAALLVALPQSPEARRPDRHGQAARAARDRVLARAARHQVLARDEAEAARAEPVPTRRHDFPALAPHLADRIVTTGKQASTHHVTIDAGLQRSLETLLAERVAGLPRGVSAALIVADHRTGEIIAHLGSAGFTDGARSGWIDMTAATRSPGSALKPLIYGLAFELGLAHPETLIEDRPIRFGNWTPANFGDGYFGTVSLREALQFSLNVPAVALLDAVGPAQMMARMRRAGAPGRLPNGAVPGLAIGLGGIGMSLTDLVQLFAAIARGGEAIMLHTDPESAIQEGGRVLAPGAAWQVADILAGAPAPVAAPNRQLAFKTGTSYGYRDAWSVGFDGRHVIGVWVGRPDTASVPGITGIETAAPLLFEAFSRLKSAPAPLRPPPPDVLIVAHSDLPPPLAEFRGFGNQPRIRGPEITFPPDGARVDLGGARPAMLSVKIRDGVPPFTWMVDGKPVETGSLERELSWAAPGAGFVSIAVIDGQGQADRTRIVTE